MIKVRYRNKKVFFIEWDHIIDFLGPPEIYR